MQGPPRKRMSEPAPLIPNLDSLLYEYVLTENLLGGTVTYAYIASESFKAFKAMHARGKVGADMRFKASSGFVFGFKRRFTLRSHLSCGESGSANNARDDAYKILGDLKITRAFGV